MEEHSDICDISVGATNVTKEVSDSNSCSFLIRNKRKVSDSNSCSFLICNKRQKLDSNTSSSKFKGVVIQPNGHWGAQIYYKNERIWLGTFKSEIEAAMAYDSAAIKVRNQDSHRNFPWTNITTEERNFQSQFGKETVLNMIKDGSYPSKFVDYLRAECQSGQKNFTVPRNGDFHSKELFQKELTPSDVGKLNRLVIPKKFALMYFSHSSVTVQENEESALIGDTELVFYDSTMRSWKFRYCYWKSSQSFVFTRGWNKFVKEKGLKAKDIVIFSKYDSKNDLPSAFMIDVEYYEGFRIGKVLNASTEEREFLGTEANNSPKRSPRNVEDFEGFGIGEVQNAFPVEKDFLGMEAKNSPKESLRLFGVQII